MARSRRGRGEGSIYQRGDGTWCATISAGYSAAGKRRRKTVYGATKTDVQDGLRQVASEVAAGASVECQKLTVAEFLDRWLKSAKDSLAPTSWERYRHVVEHELKPYIGGVRLAKLVPVHVEGLYVTLKDAGRSARAIQLAGVTLGCAIQHAVRVHLLLHNPVRGIPKPRVPRSEMKVWDSAAASAFLKAASLDRLHAMYVLALSAGLRQGELFGLEWADVDFDSGSVTVRRSIEEISGKLRAKEPKTGKGRRIDIPGFAVDALRAHRAKMLAEGNISAPVFCAREGGWLRKGNVYRRSFIPLIASAGVPRVRFHDLRHTSATLLLLAGENVKVVSERLGHASIKVTLDTYAHVLPSMQKGAADKLQRLLG